MKKNLIHQYEIKKLTEPIISNKINLDMKDKRLKSIKFNESR